MKIICTADCTGNITMLAQQHVCWMFEDPSKMGLVPETWAENHAFPLIYNGQLGYIPPTFRTRRQRALQSLGERMCSQDFWIFTWNVHKNLPTVALTASGFVSPSGIPQVQILAALMGNMMFPSSRTSREKREFVPARKTHFLVGFKGYIPDNW